MENYLFKKYNVIKKLRKNYFVLNTGILDLALNERC